MTFYSFDDDHLNSIKLILKFVLVMVKMYLYAENELICCGYLKL